MESTAEHPFAQSIGHSVDTTIYVPRIRSGEVALQLPFSKLLAFLSPAT